METNTHTLSRPRRAKLLKLRSCMWTYNAEGRAIFSHKKGQSVVFGRGLTARQCYVNAMRKLTDQQKQNVRFVYIYQ